MPKNILLPGGIGYIGSHVAIELLEQTPHHLTLFDNCSNSNADNIQRVLQSVQADVCAIKGEIDSYRQRVSFYEGDILDQDTIAHVFECQLKAGRPITTIMHFAAKKSAPESMSMPFEYYQNNVVGSMNLLRFMGKDGCCEFIFSSSAAVYGEQDNCTEDFECHPISPYGESKLVVDMLLKSEARSKPHLKYISLRYFNPAGNHHRGLLGDNPIGNIPGNLFSVIQEVIIGKRNALTVYGSDYNTPDGTGVRDFVHVTDLAVGHVKALQYLPKMNNTHNYQVFNFGSGHGYSVLEVLKCFQKQLSQTLNHVIGKRRPGDLERLVTVSDKAEKVLGWKAKKSLDDMCSSCIKFTVSLLETVKADD